MAMPERATGGVCVCVASEDETVSQGKTIYAACGESRLVRNLWAAEIERRGTTVSSSAWELSGSLTLGTVALTGSTTTALVTVNGSGTAKNTVTLANGEILSVWRRIEAS